MVTFAGRGRSGRSREQIHAQRERVRACLSGRTTDLGTGMFLIPPQAMLSRSFVGSKVCSMLFPIALSKTSASPLDARTATMRRDFRPRACGCICAMREHVLVSIILLVIRRNWHDPGAPLR